uniref:Uncharacterized protein n=1 Tax=uncultured delta proteobacterium HF0130_19C20 TaxID=710828 RepID=E0XT82_9DELT|nr:hypothetical protein [uncultured delta proteobacterium HF0130_19C20]
MAHYAKGTRSHMIRRSVMLPLLVDTGFQELFHSSVRGAFHLSLTVLVHYRSPGNI